jgi:ElaA protein
MTGPDGADQLTVASFADLDTTMLYALLKLRTDVFVVEQECPYPELDGRDAEPGTLHVWLGAATGDGPQGYLRVLTDPDGSARIGRVCVAKSARGGGVAGRLMSAALDLAGHRRCVLDAQSYLVAFYSGFGFTPTGPEYVEDGIPHVPMARPAQ